MKKKEEIRNELEEFSISHLKEISEEIIHDMVDHADPNYNFEEKLISDQNPLNVKLKNNLENRTNN
jgi:hypothetical protein